MAEQQQDVHDLAALSSALSAMDDAKVRVDAIVTRLGGKAAALDMLQEHLRADAGVDIDASAGAKQRAEDRRQQQKG